MITVNSPETPTAPGPPIPDAPEPEVSVPDASDDEDGVTPNQSVGTRRGNGKMTTWYIFLTYHVGTLIKIMFTLCSLPIFGGK